MPTRRFFLHFSALLALSLAAAGCPSAPSPEGGSTPGTETAAPSRTSLSVKGSDTMVQLGQRWAEVYMGNHAEVSIQVIGGGSGTGISALINGTTDICQSSRPMKDAEKADLKGKHGLEVTETAVALDGLAIYVHESNGVKQLSIPEIKDVYQGKITNWKDVGGIDKKIVVYGRENNSGTYEYFKEHVLSKEDFAPMVQTLPGTAAVADAVAKDPAGVGYGGIAYAKGIRIVPVSKDKGGAAVEATLQTVEDNSYPLSRSLYWYTAGSLSPAVSAFADWILSPEGQKVVTEVGYYPIRKEGRSGSPSPASPAAGAPPPPAAGAAVGQ